jgi:hypothetical protein
VQRVGGAAEEGEQERAEEHLEPRDEALVVAAQRLDALHARLTRGQDALERRVVSRARAQRGDALAHRAEALPQPLVARLQPSARTVRALDGGGRRRPVALLVAQPRDHRVVPDGGDGLAPRRRALQRRARHAVVEDEHGDRCHDGDREERRRPGRARHRPAGSHPVRVPAASRG